MPDLWLPGFERWELPGVPGLPYDEPDDPKAVLHSTEGDSIDGAVAAYRAYPPQLIVDPARRRKVQHIPLNRAGYALWNGDADDSRCYQVEIVGYASRMHQLSDEDLRWLGEELARPLHEYGGVPYVVVWKGFRRDGEMPYVLASVSSPLRLTQAELDSFSGFLGHQHIPGDIHWDPGGLNVPRILEFARRGGSSTSLETLEETLIERTLPATSTPATFTLPVPTGRRYRLQIVPTGQEVKLHAVYNWGSSPNNGKGGNPVPGNTPITIKPQAVGVYDLPAGTGKADVAYQSETPVLVLLDPIL